MKKVKFRSTDSPLTAKTIISYKPLWVEDDTPDLPQGIEQCSGKGGNIPIRLLEEEKWEKTFIVKILCGEVYVLMTLTQFLRVDRGSLMATFDLVADWVRLLPLEFYYVELLAKIRRSMGILLHSDDATSSELRGKCPRFWIQVNIENPLKKYLMVYGHKQSIHYEGLESFCF
ncbi:hypothetical protein Godav_004499 [Gossypium davidsonii]|uniref:Uncharacterized protein n=2 Tax=Gossypium TaxID=3633 RepID=A0A7J8SLI1_GOSDV|nr:hypothetical protein [Gossypium davidsonii]MBA0662542.1 hypothetical protein [Gossypium klotzschianum]